MIILTQVASGRATAEILSEYHDLILPDPVQHAVDVPGNELTTVHYEIFAAYLCSSNSLTLMGKIMTTGKTKYQSV